MRIEGCNNTACRYWEDGQCELPLLFYMNGVAHEKQRSFDYDYHEGTFVCKDVEEN